MGYIDAQGRPEWTAQPFVKKGTAQGRVVPPELVDELEPAAASAEESSTS
jgi:hypothetical protein